MASPDAACARARRGPRPVAGSDRQRRGPRQADCRDDASRSPGPPERRLHGRGETRRRAPRIERPFRSRRSGHRRSAHPVARRAGIAERGRKTRAGTAGARRRAPRQSALLAVGTARHAAHRGTRTRSRGGRGRGARGRGVVRGWAGAVRTRGGRSISSRNSSTAGIGARRDGAQDPATSRPATRAATTAMIPSASSPAAPLASPRIEGRPRPCSADPLTVLPAWRRPPETTRSRRRRRSG